MKKLMVVLFLTLGLMSCGQGKVILEDDKIIICPDGECNAELGAMS